MTWLRKALTSAGFRDRGGTLNRIWSRLYGCYRLQDYLSTNGFSMAITNRATLVSNDASAPSYSTLAGDIMFHRQPLHPLGCDFRVYGGPVMSNHISVGSCTHIGIRGFASVSGGGDNEDGSEKEKGSGGDDRWDFSAEGDEWNSLGIDEDAREIKADENIEWGTSVIDEGDDWSKQTESSEEGKSLLNDVTEDRWNSKEEYESWAAEVNVQPSETQPEDREAWEKAVKAAKQADLQREEEHLTSALEGPKRAFGDLIAASGLTEVQIESLIVMKDLQGVKGLPPLQDIENARLSRLERKSIRSELEQQRQDERSRARVRHVDEKGRAYGTGRRKTSVARVWIQPGNGKFIVNEKSFDIYFRQLAHRTDLLSPFIITKTLGLWDVVTKVQGGGLSGQAGAIRLGISRALQNWEPGFRPYLRAAGLLTRDARVVERKKPGKAKARRSFQWVKR